MKEISLHPAVLLAWSIANQEASLAQGVSQGLGCGLGRWISNEQDAPRGANLLEELLEGQGVYYLGDRWYIFDPSGTAIPMGS